LLKLKSKLLKAVVMFEKNAKFDKAVPQYNSTKRNKYIYIIHILKMLFDTF